MSLNVAALDASVSSVAVLVVSAPAPHPIDALHRRIVADYAHTPLHHALLPSVHIGPAVDMHIFRIHQHVDPDPFADLDVSGVNVIELSSFSPQDLVFPAFPPKALRTTVSHFLNAVRAAFIDRVARDNAVLGRLNAGFLLAYPTSANEWSAPWAVARPFTFCHLQIHLAQSRLIIHPLLIPTSFLPLAPSLPPGTPITLLPYATPAYYLSTYRGPTSALAKQFQDAFVGLGVHAWNPDAYIIAWVIVENRQGEDKGVTIIYPASLCIHSMSSNHPPLPHIPTLPTALQSSPSATGSPTPAMAFLSLSSPTSSSAFRTLTGSKSRDIDQIASEVGGFVDAVAKERERERERLKKVTRTPSQSQAPPPPPPSYHPMSPALQQQPTPQHLQQQQTADTFYPSPPQANAPIPIPPPTSTSTSNIPPAPPVPQPQNMNMMDVDPQPIQSSYASYDSNWMQDLLSLQVGDVGGDMGMGMGMGMGVGMGDFEADFTEDDFSFFDAKPSGGGAGIGLTPAVGGGGTGGGGAEDVWDVVGGGGGGSGGRGVGMGGMGPGSVQALATPDVHHPGYALPSPSPEKAMPNFRVSAIPIHSQTQTQTQNQTQSPTQNQNAPPTGGGGGPGGEWDAISFDESYRRVDGKYRAGKFTVRNTRTSSSSGTRTGASGLLSPPSESEGWYERQTDPSRGVVERLMMLKRKGVGNGNGVGNGRESGRVGDDDEWEREWAGTRRRGTGTGNGYGNGDQGEGEDGDGDGDEEEDSDDDDDMAMDLDQSDSSSSSGDRPSTPLPPYLPLGPTLIALQFKHEFMLPLSGPLRAGGNPGAGVAIGTAASSVPTPVSPGRGGKGRVLEAAAEALGREMVENSVWAGVWSDVNGGVNGGAGRQGGGGAGGGGGGGSGSGGGGGGGFEIWGRDVQAVSRLFAGVEGVKAPLAMADLFGLGSPASEERFEKLEPPMLLVGKGEAVIQVSPPALRFWDKLGLAPRSGKKDIQAFFAFDVMQDDLSPRVGEWLAALGTVYESKHFGKISPGKSDFCDDGVVKIRYDSSLRKSFDAFVTGIPPPPPRSNIVVFILTPLSTLLAKSPVMRQLFSVVRKASKASDSHILFQFIPEQILRPEYHAHLDTLALSLYDRIRVPVVRSMSRKLFQVGEVKKYLEDPAFVLARSAQEAKMLYSPDAVLDVVDRGTFLHVAYAVSECEKWICASCVDQRGEGHDVGVWLSVKGGGGGGGGGGEGDPEADPEVGEMAYLVGKVWDFAVRFAKRANVEWRIVIAKLGAMDEAELDAWTSHLENGAYEPAEMGPVHVSIVAVDPSTPWMFTSRPTFDTPPTTLKGIGRSVSVSNAKPAKSSTNPVFVDVSSTTYALFQHSPLPVSVPPTPVDMGLTPRHIPDSDSAEPGGHGHEDHPHTLPLVPHASATLIRVPASSGACSMLHVHLLHKMRSEGCVYPASDYPGLVRDIAHSYYALSVLGVARGVGMGMGNNPILPYHLSAVEGMRGAVGVGDPAAEGGVDS